MNLFTNINIYYLNRWWRKTENNQQEPDQQQRRSLRTTGTANCELSLAFTFLLVILGCFAISTDGFKINARDTPRDVCYHNGTLYGNGSLVPTMEPCLSCQCANRTLLCSLRVCHDQPVPPPRGCVIVHHKNKCCPHMFCKRFHKRPNSELDRKIVNFLDNFEQEQLAVEDRYKEFDGNENALRRRSEDPDSSDQFCVQNGTIYQSGSAMTTSSLCSYCYCINGKQRCVKPKCQLPHVSKHCVPVYMESSCCPLKYDCGRNGNFKEHIVTSRTVTHGNSHKLLNKWTPKQKPETGLSMEDFTNLPDHRQKHSCILNGRIFVEGEKMPVDLYDPCNICFCIHGESKCTAKKCTPPMKNCVPIIPTGQCCPSGYKCNMAKPRQFGFFDILFGADENSTDATGTPDDMSTMPPFIPLAPLNTELTSEKSLFDVLRDGLNYVEKNEDHFESAMEKSVIVSEETVDNVNVKKDSLALVTVTESASDEYFDYENSDPDDDELFPVSEDIIHVSQVKENKDSILSTSSTTTTPERTTKRQPLTTKKPITTKKVPATTTMKYKASERTPVTSRPTTQLEISTIKFIPSPTRAVNLASSMPLRDTIEHETKAPLNEKVPITANNSQSESILSAFLSGLADIFDEKFKPNATKDGANTMDTQEFTIKTTHHPMTIAPSKKPQFYITPSSSRPVPVVREEIRPIPIEYTMRPASVTLTTEKIFTTLQPSSTTPTPTTIMTTSQAPNTSLNPLKTSTAATITERATTGIIISTSQSITTSATTNSPTSMSKNNEKHHSTQTGSLLSAKPLAIPPTVYKPSLTDSDYHFDYIEPTLPPSLPNLKIIPFLPADAVKHDRKTPYAFYGINMTSYPSITTEDKESSHGQYELGVKTVGYSNSYVKEQMSHDIIRKGDEFKYSTVTEPTDAIVVDKIEYKNDYDYLLDGLNLQKNGYGDDYQKNNFDVDVNSYMSFKSTGPVYKKGSSNNVNRNRVESVGTAEITNVNAELRTEAPKLELDLNRFSPPKVTEGGFQPRDPERFYNPLKTIQTAEQSTEFHTEDDLIGYDAIKRNHFLDKSAANRGSVDPNTISITTDRSVPEMKGIVDSLLIPEIIRQSDDQDEIADISMGDPENDGLFGNLFTMIFKDEEGEAGDKKNKTTTKSDFKIKSETPKNPFTGVEIPPFKSISTDFDLAERNKPSEFEDPLNLTAGEFKENYSGHSQDSENGTAIKNILLDLLGHGHSPFAHASTVNIPSRTSAAPKPTPALKQSLKFPVHSNPYIVSNPRINSRPVDPIKNVFNSIQGSLNPVGPKYGQILSDDLNLTSHNLETIKRHQSEKPPKIYAKPLPAKNIDLGLLKLAGCNIYGRMYRVGRIISELSGPCMQCMCEEVGVHCTPLEC